MREIKFRAWDGHKMRTDFTMHSDGQIIISASVYAIGFVPILMQYTGLKDQNGVEIFEGDIVKTMRYPFYGDALEVECVSKRVELNYLGVVGIDTDGCYYDLKVVSNRVRGSACGGSLSEINGECEAIGNIYENPELLEVVR